LKQKPEISEKIKDKKNQECGKCAIFEPKYINKEIV
jgi:hypothetical protein